MWGTDLSSSEKLRKRIAKLRGKGKLALAVELQVQLCKVKPPVLEDWRALRDISREASLPKLQIAAGLMVAKLERAGPQQWLELAELAEAAGLQAEAMDATFGAADAAAISGDCQLAISLCDRVLARRADHAAARRIRGVMLARLEAEDDDPSSAPADWHREPTFTMLGGHAAPDWPAAARGLSGEFVAEPPDTITDWPPYGRMPPVEHWQPWPTILGTQSLLFAGQLHDLPPGDELSRLAEPRVLRAGQILFDEGDTCDLLYRLDQGTMRVSRVRAGRVDLGSVEPGSFFADVGALSRLPASARVEAVEPCTLSVVSRRKLRELIGGGSPVEAALDILKSLYLDAVLCINPLFAACPREARATLMVGARFLTTRSGECVLEPGQSGPLQIIVAGLAEVTVDDGGEPCSLGLLVPADLIAEIDPSPVRVTARRDLCTLSVERGALPELPEPARSALHARTARCRQALGAEYSTYSNGERCSTRAP